MIYSNIRVTAKGRQGSAFDYSFAPPTNRNTSAAATNTKVTSETDTELTQDPAVFLGEVNGRIYRYFPNGLDMSQVGEQAPEIDFRLESNLSEDVRLSLRTQATCNLKKQSARDEITLKVGDVLDIVADIGQLVEFAVIGVSALLADKAGVAPLSEHDLKNYGARSAAVLKAVASGDLMLRSSFETPQKMITTIMPRYSLIQKIVRDRYIEPLKELGL